MIYDIFYVSRNKINETDWLSFNNRFPSSQKIENVKTFLDISKKSFTKLFWVVWDDLTILEDFNFSYVVSKWDEQYIHVFKNAEYFDGVTLFPKNSNISSKEFQHRFYINKKEIDVTASLPKPFEKFYINTYDEYLETINNTTSDMFWVVWNDLIISEDFDFNYYIPYYDYFHRNITHIFKNAEHFDGVTLFSKNTIISKKEFDNRFFISKKEIDIIASFPKKYDAFIIDTFEDYESAVNNSKTLMFWAIFTDIEIVEDFKFDYQVPYHNQHITHIFKNGEYYDGVCLFSKKSTITKKEFDNRFFSNKKEVDVIASTPKSYDIFNLNSYEDYTTALEKSNSNMFWAVFDNIEIVEDFKFDYQVPFYNQHITHIFKNGDFFDGVCLFSKYLPITKKEFDHRFYINKKEIDIIASTPRPFEKFYINTYDQYLETINNTTSDMFWVVWNDIEIDYDFNYYIPYYDYFHRNITHIFKNAEYFDGLCLFSKNTTISKKEFEHRFFTNKKEVDLVVSKPKIYDKFIIDSYDDYLTAKNNSSTDMFWVIPEEVLVDDNFKFDLYFSHHNVIDRNMNHVFKNMFRGEETYTGISLVSKNKELSQKEITHRFLVEKKHHDIVASKLCPYDIVFISYNEPTADNNFRNLKSRFPRAKRVHGVKGIHQAHIAAAKLAKTCMFWVVDGDAEIVEDFNFDHEVSTYEKDIVHVWRSKNPINDLVYGYGGVKLLPTSMTLNMDTFKPDMTTSISSKFKAVKAISNITAFNTDPFNTWKSAFRECCKLSSKIINRQKDEETLHRLSIWCTVGTDRPFGDVAIAGAKAGSEYGSANKDNLEALKKINDFDWLKRKFDE